MALLKQGILGGISGSIGNVTGGSWKGKAYIRTKPLSVANPNTAAQVGQRTKFSVIQSIASILLVAIIKPLWDRFAQGVSGYNNFIKQNIGAVSSLGVVTFANLRTSIGSLTPIVDLALTIPEADARIELTWTDNTGTGTAGELDAIFVAAYNVDQDEWVMDSGSVTRSTGVLNVTIPATWVVGDVVHVYVSARRADGTLVSNSVYATETIVA